MWGGVTWSGLFEKSVSDEQEELRSEVERFWSREANSEKADEVIYVREKEKLILESGR